MDATTAWLLAAGGSARGAGWAVGADRFAGDVFVAGRDAPGAVLAAMAAEGLLVPVLAGVHVAADRANLSGVRAAALAELIGADLAGLGVIGGAAALWVRCIGDPCPPVVVLTPPARAGGSAPRVGPVQVRSALALAAGDVMPAGAVRVTSLARTGADIARWGGADEAAVVSLLAAVLDAGCPSEQVLAVLARAPRAPGARAAAQRVRVAAALTG